ncbi:MAG: hypothetical protein Q3999_08520 [Buchananella hordeovulneris]|nr:hypothetical protein [Buchananella hordeovulneris]
MTNEAEVTQELPFHMIQLATWEAEPRVLTVKRVDPAQADLVIQLASDDVERFSHALVDAVEHAVVYSAAVKLPGGRWARATVRRSSDGELLSDVVGTARKGVDDAAVESLLKRVHEVVGMAT